MSYKNFRFHSENLTVMRLDFGSQADPNFLHSLPVRNYEGNGPLSFGLGRGRQPDRIPIANLPHASSFSNTKKNKREDALIFKLRLWRSFQSDPVRFDIMRICVTTCDWNDTS